MINKINFHINELESMKKYPNDLYFIGNEKLLKKYKISIVGSRKPNQYSRDIIFELASKLANKDVCIVSGGAIGIDSIAHKAAGTNNTIMIAGTGLDKRYPAINKKMIEDIENNGLVLSQFKKGVPSNKWNFPLRNELVVALSEILIVAYADENSGTMRSVQYALKMKKQIYVLPHRIAQSSATNKLLQNNQAKAIYDIDEFVNQFTNNICEDIQDEFLNYCKKNPNYDEAINIYSSKVFEYELSGKIQIINGKIQVI